MHKRNEIQFAMVFSAMIILIVLCSINYLMVNSNVIETENGKLMGTIMLSKQGRNISAFMGIPYAKPPINELRFMPPIPYGNWAGVLNGTKVHPVCPQRDIYRRSETFEGDEDCLYLNVYIPSDVNKSLPVMVFFHGGGWLCGSGNYEWYGPEVLLDQDVILVIPNYRLGALGFLSTGDATCPGNNGLKDQLLALEWIQSNIKHFGGNPQQVTLFGESAGGASVHYHMLSPKSRGLFHRGVAMSGTAQCVWACAPSNEGVENSKKLAKSIGCPTESSQSMIECLKKADAMDIVKSDVVFMDWDFDPMIPFKPTIEPKLPGAFIWEDPADIIKSGQSAPVPLIVGITSEDGALRAAAILNNETLLKELNSDFDKLLPISLMYEKTAEDVHKMTKKIKEFYFDNEKIDWTKKIEFIDMYTDGWFKSCADKTVELHVNYTTHPVYYYYFAHRGVASFTKIFGGGDLDYGVCHADDLQYMFPVGDSLFPDKTPSNDDKCITKLFTTLLANFASYNNPTPNTSDVIPDLWKNISKTNEIDYYLIHSRSPGMKSNLLPRRTRFWKNLNQKTIHDEL